MHLSRHTVQACGADAASERHVLAQDREGRGQGRAQVHTQTMTGLSEDSAFTPSSSVYLRQNAITPGNAC